MSNSSGIFSSTDPRGLVSRRYLWFSIGLSVLGMVAVLWWTGAPDGFHHLKPKRLPGLAIALTVAMLRIWLSAAKIRYLADKTLSWIASFRIVLFWDFASAITPSTIGGAPVATYVMTQEGISLGKSGAIMLYSMLLDQLLYVAIIPILVIAGIYYEVIPIGAGAFGTGALMVGFAFLMLYAILLAYGILRNPNVLRIAFDYATRLPGLKRIRSTVMNELDRLVDFSTELNNKPPSFILNAFLISTLGWVAKFAVPTIVVLSFLPADWLLSFVRSIGMTLAGFFMPTPGGSGGVEGLFALFQGPLFDRPQFIGIAIFIWRLFTFYISIGFGMLVLTWYVNPANRMFIFRKKMTDG